MIILHESYDRIVQGSRPVIAESLYHGVFFCLPLYRKKVTELSCANMCKISKNGRKHLFNSAKYSIHLKHSKHPFMQKTAVRNPEMTAILQKRRPSEKRAALSQYRFSKGAFRASGLKQPVPPSAFCAPRKTALQMQNRSRDFHLPPKKRRRLCRPQAANNLNHKSPRHARGDLFFLLRSSPSWHYDSRALSGAPIVLLPRNRLASSATGGASPISMRVAIYSSHGAECARLRRVRCSGAHPPQKKRTAKAPCW